MLFQTVYNYQSVKLGACTEILIEKWENIVI